MKKEKYISIYIYIYSHIWHCEGWWLLGLSSVVNYWWLEPGALEMILSGC